MSFSNSILRSPSHTLSSSSRVVAQVQALPYFASTGPSIFSKTLVAVPKPVTTIPTPTTSPTPSPDLTPRWFNSTPPRLNPPSDLEPEEPHNERKVKLGKTLRILQKRLPTVLQTPLPQEILSPNISLHLFPSTHPYLPTVSGRVGYTAALWTSPIAWNRVPIIGNLKIEILSERMTTQPLHFLPQRTGAYPEQLVVKWRTVGKSEENPSLTEQGEQKLDETLRGTQSRGENKEFTGLFIFEFDKDGKIISHTIEHVDQSGAWEKGVGAKVVHLTDWLLGELRGRQPQGCPLFQTTNNDKKGRY